jgi:retron-type reverse transcriptase
MTCKQFTHSYHSIISPENLLLGWRDFARGKRNKKDVQQFQLRLMEHIEKLHMELANKTYIHGGYHAFNISDPKPRNIHKATVRDRLLHHAVYRVLYPFFDFTFIADSYSCRLRKGTHRAMNQFRNFGYKVSKNNTKTVWVLKCDIRKFFASIDQGVLYNILKTYTPDQDILWLLERVVGSFETKPGKGLPLGNLTSQLLVNIYMNEFDQFVKHKLKSRYYVRYADDFVLMSNDKNELEAHLLRIQTFLFERLQLELHPDKVFIKTLASGIDFLGWVHFPNHRVLRTSTKKKMFRGIAKSGGKPETVQSYLGLLSHGNTHKLKQFLNKGILH